MNWKASDYALAIVSRYEGCRLTTYADSTGRLTVGTGHTGADVIKGMTITQQQADDLLRKDVAWAERCVNARVMALDSQGQFDALVSWTFNLGCSTLGDLLPILPDYDAVAEKMTHYTSAGGTVLNGLVRRRTAEACLFLGYGDALATGCQDCMQDAWDACLINGKLSTVPHAKRVEAGQFTATVGKDTQPITDEQILKTGLV